MDLNLKRPLVDLNNLLVVGFLYCFGRILLKEYVIAGC